jgi:uncharacterized protein (TIGR00375 family)
MTFQPEAGSKQNPVALQPIFADLHVHIGSSAGGLPVKISASRNLTFQSIAHEASVRKGIRMVGVIDSHSPPVQEDIMRLLDAGEMEEAAGGGIRYKDTVLILGVEMEIREPGGGPFHLLGYLPNLAAMQQWTKWLAARTKNIQLSSQRVNGTARELQAALLELGGILAPAHVFTPHRGLLGCSADRLADRLDPAGIAAIELGLSADTQMAQRLSQLDSYPFLTNSDAHSTGMIARECNELLIGEPSFDELLMALRSEQGRRIVANYGLHPRLGKYHTTWCSVCQKAFPDASASMGACPQCGGSKLVRGVAGRVEQLADRGEASAGIADVTVYGLENARADSSTISPVAGAKLDVSVEARLEAEALLPVIDKRPPYRHLIPLSFFPGIGPRMMDRLLGEVGTEMDILLRVPGETLAKVAGDKLAQLIIAAREQRVSFISGSGGAYGKLVVDTTNQKG